MARRIPVVKGVRWGVAEAGIRKRGGLDLGLMLCSEPAAAAAVFTRSHAAAAPVLLSRRRVRGGRAAAILVNAGCANACTTDGAEVAEASTAAVAAAIGARPGQVLVASTGVIGARLPVRKLVAAIGPLVASAVETGLPDFARAIMTTDTRPKLAAAAAGRAMVAGCAKGAGMIMPRMATLLGFVATDAGVSPPLLRRLLAEAAHDSFNAVTVDGDTSTNDSLFLLATGASGVEVRPGSAASRAFGRALAEVCGELARAVARDGEGATRLVTVHVTGARSASDADAIGRRIANSLLVKTALHAADANWGRIVAAAGTAGVRVDAARMTVGIGPATVFAGGAATTLSEERAAGRHLRGTEVELRVDLGAGSGRRTIYTCDLSAEYVKINAEYRS